MGLGYCLHILYLQGWLKKKSHRMPVLIKQAVSEPYVLTAVPTPRGTLDLSNKQGMLFLASVIAACSPLSSKAASVLPVLCKMRQGTLGRGLPQGRGFRCRGHRSCRLPARGSSAADAPPGASLSLMLVEQQVPNQVHPLQRTPRTHRWLCLTGLVQAQLPQMPRPDPAE